jgi:D-beta-D-heptose 7-phosphate kinase/D-beta-D-heptose 1-phosphate adenosyltransferase
MNSDRSVRALKGADRPILAEQERAALLSGLSCVDAVVVFDEDDPALLIDELQPDVLVKGADYQVDQIVGAASVQARGGSVVTIDLISGVSSSAVADRLRRAGAAPPPAVPAR